MRSTASTTRLWAVKRQNDGKPLKQLLIVSVHFAALFVGIVPTAYLMRDALYLISLAIVFGTNAPHTTTPEYLAFVGANSVPAICYAVIAIAGFLLWRSQKYRIGGLLAVLVQVVLAVYNFVNPESMPDFGDWLLR